MKKVKVTITKLAGETGLRKPGITLLMYPKVLILQLVDF